MTVTPSSIIDVVPVGFFGLLVFQWTRRVCQRMTCRWMCRRFAEFAVILLGNAACSRTRTVGYGMTRGDPRRPSAPPYSHRSVVRLRRIPTGRSTCRETTSIGETCNYVDIKTPGCEAENTLTALINRIPLLYGCLRCKLRSSPLLE